jgi:hypothetical protein
MHRLLQADLDNLKLGELPVPLGGGAALHARFQLEALLLTGQCIDPGARRREEVRHWWKQWDGRGAKAHHSCVCIHVHITGACQLVAVGTGAVYHVVFVRQQLPQARRVAEPAALSSRHGYPLAAIWGSLHPADDAAGGAAVAGARAPAAPA